jgi:hypothetical protein
MSEIMTQELTTAEPSDVSIIHIIEKISQTPNLTLESIGVLERLVALQDRRDEQQRKERFFDALTRVQSQVTRVAQTGLMDRGPGKGQIPYARREDIDAMVRPIYLAEGFSVTWDAPTSDDSGNIHVQGRFTCHGHTEMREWSCKPDASGGKTGPQAVSSTIAYGKRQIEKMFFNIIEEGADKNGAAEVPLMVSQHDADDIRTRMNDLPQKSPGALLGKLCQKHGVERPEELRASQYLAVIADVEATEKLKAAR